MPRAASERASPMAADATLMADIFASYYADYAAITLLPCCR